MFWGIQTERLAGVFGVGVLLGHGLVAEELALSTTSRREAGIHSPWLSAAVTTPWGRRRAVGVAEAGGEDFELRAVLGDAALPANEYTLAP